MANRVRLLVTDDALYVANTGRPIDRIGVISISRQYLSAKGETPPEDTFTCSDRKLVDAIRDKRISLYQQEKNDLKEHASQEEQTRRDYAGRALWELLQNADDAMAPAGCPSSELIGAKGLGFKSVLEITDRPEVHSGAFHFCFDPDRSETLLRKVLPEPARLVFRLPHRATPDEQTKRLRSEGFTTVIKLPFKDAASRAVTEQRLLDLPPHFMLLCQHLRIFEAEFSDGRKRLLARQGGQLGVDASRATLKIAEDDHCRSEEWRVWSRVWPPPAASEKRLSVALAVQVDGKAGIRSAEELPLHVFYPTQELMGLPFLVHGSFELRSDRNHLLAGSHDTELLSTLGELASRVTNFLTPQSVLELFRDLAKLPPANVTKLDRKIQRVLGKAVLDSSFVPTVGGLRVTPPEARTWAHDLPAILNHKVGPVRNAKLCAAEMEEAFGALRTFGAEGLSAVEYAQMLNYAHCRNRQECLSASRVAHQACLSGVYSPSPAVLNVLSEAPFWLTSTGQIRSLTGDRPLVRSRPEVWPKWLAADDLDAEFAVAVLGKDSEVGKSWAPLMKGRLLQSTEDIITHCLVPVLATWSEKAWSKLGWEALTALYAWKPELEWAKIRPYVQGLSPDPDPARTALIGVARVPHESKWVASRECYASPKIGGNSELAEFHREQSHRPIVGMPAKAKPFGRTGWRSLLRYLGVSWEPKIRRVQQWHEDGDTCSSRFWNAITETRLNWREVDWYLDYFPECVQQVSAQSVVKMLETLLPVTSKLAAAYSKRSDSSATHRPKPFASFVDYQLRREPYLPCHPSMTHPSTRGVPKDLYWPDRGIRGITPILDFGGLPVAQRQRVRSQFLQQLGIQENLPDRWQPWLTWADELAESVEAGKVDLKERFVREFYELFLRTKFLLPKPRQVKRLVCVTNDGLQSVPSAEAVWIDDPKFAVPDVQRALIAQGLALFPPMLDRGDQAVARLGVRRASEVVTVTANYVEAPPDQADRLTKRIHHCRRAFAAVCEKKLEHWVDPPSIIAVHGLALTFIVDGVETATRTTQAYRCERGWLVDLDPDPWEALAIVCAAPFRNAADLRHWFARILRARSSAEIASILIDGGIPPYRLREISLPDDVEEEDHYPSLTLTGEDDTATGEKGQEQEADKSTVGHADDGIETTNPERPEVTPIDDEEHGPSSALTPTLKKRALYESVNPGKRNSVTGRSAAATAAERAAASGLAAEAWFAARLKDSIRNGWQPEFHVRDAEVRESDVTLTSSTEVWHIEIKCLTQTRIFWSQLEQQKAQAHPERYCMALLVPQRTGEYSLYWCWDPLSDLLVCDRRLDWVWDSTGQGPPLPPNSWEPLAGLRRPERPADRANFVIEMRDQVLKALPRDDRTLSLLWAKVSSSSTKEMLAAE